LLELVSPSEDKGAHKLTLDLSNAAETHCRLPESRSNLFFPKIGLPCPAGVFHIPFKISVSIENNHLFLIIFNKALKDTFALLCIVLVPRLEPERRQELGPSSIGFDDCPLSGAERGLCS